MSRLRLSLACGRYDRTLALERGDVVPEGIDLTFVAVNPAEGFWRQLHYGDFDIAEMSMSAYIMLASRGDDRFVAIPAFTSRAFRHGMIFVRDGAGVTNPEDLRGKRIGVPQFHMTAALWIRGILGDDFGLDTREVRWVQGGLDSPGYPERIELRLPSDIHLERRQDASLSDLLVAGEIDAIIGAEIPSPFIRKEKGISRLFADYPRREQEFHARTGFFPIMHCVAIRRDVYERNRWISQNLLRAFEASKRLAQSALPFAGAAVTMLPWQAAEYDRTVDSMGQDYWPYGLPANHTELETMCRYSNEQGLSPEALDAGELFVPETREALPAAVFSH